MSTGTASHSPVDDFDPFAAGAIARVVATTEPQREIWLADRLSEAASLAYNESITLELHGAADREALTAAIRDLIAAHESLRATISADGQQMIVAESSHIDIPVHDLLAASEAARQAAVQAAKARAVSQRFDLEAGPLVRAEVLALAADSHVLIFTAHHIVCDGWSFGVIVRDLAGFYNARRGAAAGPGPGESFAEYAEQESQHHGSELQRTDEAFWISKFASSVPTLDLPTDRPRRAWRTFSSQRADVILDAALVAEVRRWGAKQGAGLPATLTGAFAALLHRIAGAASVVVGMPAAGQSVGGHERLVGHCVNLLPLRFDFADGKSIAQLISEAKSTLLDAYEHQRYTFGTLLQKLTLHRDPGRLPLVSVLFNVDQALDSSTLRFDGLSFECGANARIAENFELFVNAVPVAGGLRLEIQYNADLFDADTVHRWFDAYITMLREALADGSREIAALQIVSPSAMQALAALQPPVTGYDRSVLMHEFIERQVDSTPASPAVTFGDATLTYAQLDARANRIAHALRGMGVKRGVNVGLCVHRSLDMVAAIIGILKAGGTHVPLDPAFPADRLSFMTGDAALGALITETEHLSKTGIARTRALVLNEDQVLLDSQPATRLSQDTASATPDTAAYIIYTSGSTGRPKGVLVPHGAIANLLVSLQQAPGIAATDTLVAVTTISFDIAIFELMLPLTVGARVVIAARDQVRDAGALRRLLEASNATMMQATPAGWRILLESGWQGHANFKAVSGGEPLAPDLASALLQRCGSVWNGYGPTETTVYSTFWPVAAPERGISIGRPVANTTVWILDERQQACPLGVPGEICIGGDGVTLGYFNRAELTAERFLENRFDARGGRIYRTGDRGRWLANGTLEHLGRLDFQVKVRGYRVELGEIEANLLSLPNVARAVAMAREDRPGDVRLVAYVVAQPGASVTEEALRTHLQSILPEYFVPQHLLVLPAIPLLPNGKVDRKALPAPEAPKRERDYVAPRNDLETSLAATMEAVLGLPGIGINDDFFALGGHSLLAAQLTARINREFGIKLTLRTLFDAPSVARLAEKIATEQAANSPDTQAPIAVRNEQRKAPLSIMQERLWFLEQLHPGRVVYNTPSAHRLRGKLDYDIFARAFAEMVRHQPSLRTAIAVENGTALQVVHENIALALVPPEDLSSIGASERESALRTRLETLTNEPFDLTQPPLFRVRLFKLSDQEHVLLFVPHHIIWDGWSFDLFYAELAAVYEAFLANRPSPLAPLPISYGDFAVWHRQWLEGPEFARQINYWRERLADSSAVTELPVDRPRRPGMSGEGCTEWISVDKQITEGLRELSRKADVTLFMTLLALYYVLLSRTSGQRNLVVGTPVRGRDLPEVERVMGYFTNLLPLHLQIDASERFIDLVKRVKATVLDSFAHPDVPLEMLSRELTVQRGEGGSLLYQALFSFQDARHRTSNWGGLAHEQILLFQRGATEDLGLWFLDNDRGMVGGITYNADIITAQSAQLLRDRYLKLIGAVMSDPTAPVGQLDLRLEQDERSLRQWNHTTQQLQGPELLHQAFEHAAKRAPSEAAIFVGGWSVTYQEIEQQANRIAQVLVARGVAAGTVVALCDEPGQSFLAALLAVFKAGGACLILDPAMATARVTAALSSSQSAVVVGNSRYKDIVNGLQIKTVWLDADASEIAAAPSVAPQVSPIAGSSPALLIDLVGMSETPRIVVLSHAAVLNTLLAVRDAISLQPGRRCLVAGTASAETTALEWLLPWTAGAASVVVRQETLHDPQALRREIESNRIDCMHLPTEVWQRLLQAQWRASADTVGIVFGSRPSLELAEQLTQSDGAFWRAFGVAETGIWSTLSRIRKPEDALAIGRPVANLQVRVLDDNQRETPINVWGEIHAQGASLAAGHLSFASGLWGRWRSDGALELQERSDDAVFVGNTRLDLQALTRYLRQQTGVADSVCVIRTMSDGGTRLVAYVAADTTDNDLRGRLRQALSDRTPPVATPVEVVVLATLPRTPDGRIDTRALPSPEEQAGHANDAFVAPQTDTEKMLADIWCDLLGLGRVGARDNFFDLGGHSLLAMQAIVRMEQKTGRQIAARRYMFQTLAQLASSYDEPVAEAPAKKGFVGKLLGALRGSSRRP